MGPPQNMEAMFQTWKNIVFKKEVHLGAIGSFNCECTLLASSMLLMILEKMIIVASIGYSKFKSRFCNQIISRVAIIEFMINNELS
jgi:hypothetical protein